MVPNVLRITDGAFDEIENENRNDVAVLLEKEHIRRIKARPEPKVPDDTCLPLCDIPRALIEISDEQMKSLRPAPLLARCNRSFGNGKIR